MKFYLTQLRRDGKRLRDDQIERPARLVSMEIVSHKGCRQLVAHCCFGGSVFGLWDPTLIRIDDQEMTIRGMAHSGDAAVVQEWRLRPHCVATVS